MVSTKSYYVYLLTNWNNKVMYVGVTNDLKNVFMNIRKNWLMALLKNIMYISWSILRKHKISTLPLQGKKKLKNGEEKRKIKLSPWKIQIGKT